MEFYDYLTILSKKLGWFIGVWVLIVVLAMVFWAVRPETYNVYSSISVTRVGTQETPDYTYDGYYAIQASERFSETVASWFASPQFVQLIFAKAGIDHGQTSIRSLANMFNAKAVASQNVEVKFVAGSSEEARNIVNAIGQVLTEQTVALNQISNNQETFAAIISDPVVRVATLAWWSMLVIGLIVGLAGALFVVGVVHYFSDRRAQSAHLNTK